MNLNEGLAREIYRVAQIMPRYEDIGDAGKFAHIMMENAIERAFAAMGSGEAADMLAALKALQGFERKGSTIINRGVK